MPDINWAGEIGGQLAVAAFAGGSSVLGVLYKFVILPIKIESKEELDDIKAELAVCRKEHTDLLMDLIKLGKTND